MSRISRRRRTAAAALALAGLAFGIPVAGAAGQLPPPIESEPIPFDPQVVLSVCANADFVGTNGPNVIVGTPGPDVIDARGGADTVRGRGGDDVICAGRAVAERLGLVEP